MRTTHTLLDGERYLRWIGCIPQVRATAFGFPQTDREIRRELALLVYVDRKRTHASLSPLHRIPDTWRPRGRPSIPIDVVELAEPEATSSLKQGGDPEYACRVRPIRPGYSFGLANRIGTLGLVVWPKTGTPSPLLLSSSHVLNWRPDGRAYHLYQPAGRDGGRDDGPVARAMRYTRLHPYIANYTEAGLAEPLHPEDVDPTHPLAPIQGVCSQPRLGQRLRKVGRTTGFVDGEIVALDWNGSIRFGRQRYPFANQILVANPHRPISLNGDSGSVWITETGQAAAMSFGGCQAGMVSISTPLSLILQRLNVRLPVSSEEARS